MSAACAEDCDCPSCTGVGDSACTGRPENPDQLPGQAFDDSFLYPLAREYFLTAQLDWLTTEVKIALVDDQYDVDRDNNDHIDDIPPANLVAVSDTALIGKLATDGYAQSNFYTFVEFTDPLERLVSQVLIFVDDVAYFDDGLLIAHLTNGWGVPFVGLGRNYTIGYNANFRGWFRV